MSDIAIKVEGLGKKYLIGHQKSDSIKDSLKTGIRKVFNYQKKEVEEFWALNDVSFEINKGDAVGIIGKNGAGKSTLLKILSRITHPTTGRFEINGRVSSLLEVGTGFHPELSGRENIYLNGTILGMSRSEIKTKFDDIVQFSGVEKFLDTPVKHYSSGMYVRLAFAVAAHLEPEVLIIDEVLAVGDAEFQKKCLGKMDEVAKQGRTVIFVSHNMPAVKNLCNHGIFINDGTIVLKEDNIDNVIQRYQNSFTNYGQSQIDFSRRSGRGDVKLEDIKITDISKNQLFKSTVGSKIRIDLTYNSIHKNQNCHIIIGVYDMMGICCARLDSQISGFNLPINNGTGVITCETDEINISPGKYYVNIALYSNGEMQDYLNHVTYIEIENENYFGTGKEFTENLTKTWIRNKWKTKELN